MTRVKERALTIVGVTVSIEQHVVFEVCVPGLADRCHFVVEICVFKLEEVGIARLQQQAGDYERGDAEDHHGKAALNSRELLTRPVCFVNVDHLLGSDQKNFH